MVTRRSTGLRHEQAEKAIHHTTMKEGWYIVIVTLPTFVTAYGPFVILFMVGYKLEQLRRWVATYAFYHIIQAKADDLGVKRWSFKDIDLTDEDKILSRVIWSLFALFLLMFGGVVLMFYILLLLEVSFKCEPDNKDMDCFKFMMWNWETIKNFSRVAVDCNSPEAKNETVDVVCYEIVFNFGLASGASYGSFQITMAFLNLATTATLMIKQAKTICKIRVYLAVLFSGLVAGFVAVQVTTLHRHLTADNWVFSLQGTVFVLTGNLFVFAIPWKNLIALKTAEENKPSTRLRAVIPFPPVNDLEEEGSHEKMGSHVDYGRSEKRGNLWKEKGRREKTRSRKEKGGNKGQRSRKRHLQQFFQNPVAEPV